MERPPLFLLPPSPATVPSPPPPPLFLAALFIFRPPSFISFSRPIPRPTLSRFPLPPPLPCVRVQFVRVRARWGVCNMLPCIHPPVEWGPLLGAGPSPPDSDNDSDLTWARQSGATRIGAGRGPAVRPGQDTRLLCRPKPPNAHCSAAAAGSVFHLHAV